MNEAARRWRLILGPDANNLRSGQQGSPLAKSDLSDTDIARDEALDFLYRREYETRQHATAQDNLERQASTQRESLTAASWLKQVRRIFPKTVVNELQKQAIDRYQLTQLLSDPEVLSKATPNIDLVETLLTFKNHLSPELTVQVKQIINHVANQIAELFSQKIQSHFAPKRLRSQHGGRAQLNNLDWATSIRRNLKNYQPEYDSLILQQLAFYKRSEQQVPWYLYILVDQSGSMARSIIQSAVMASIFCQVHSLRTQLYFFDTEVVDMSEVASNPVDTLLACQLGGGTDIANAVEFAAARITQPQRSSVIIVSDFEEYGSITNLKYQISKLIEEQVTVIGITALDNECVPYFDENIVDMLTSLGMPIGAMTPAQLASWLAENI